jgi:hypothetical protein
MERFTGLFAGLRLGKTNYVAVPENTIAEDVWKELKTNHAQPIRITGRMVALKTRYPEQCFIFEDVPIFLLDAKENNLAGEKDKRRTVSIIHVTPSRTKECLVYRGPSMHLGATRYSVEVRIIRNETTVEEDKMPYLVEVELFADSGFKYSRGIAYMGIRV